MSIKHRTLASGNVAILDSANRVVAITKPKAFADMVRQQESASPFGDSVDSLGRTVEQSRFARRVWLDLGHRAKQYGYRTDRLTGFARKRAYRKIMRAAGIPTFVNHKAHG